MIKVVKCFFSIIFTLLFAIFLIAFLVINCMRITFTNENIIYIIKSGLNVNEINKENIIEDGMQIKQHINKNYKLNLTEQFFDSWNLPNEVTDSIVSDDRFINIISDFVASYLNYAKYKKDKPSLNIQNINDLIIEKIEQYQTNNSGFDNIEIPVITEEMANEIETFLGVGYEQKVFGEYNFYQLIEHIFSDELYFSIIFCIFFFLLIIILINMSISSVLGYTFVPLIIVGSINLLISGVHINSESNVINSIGDIITQYTYKTGCWMLIISIINLFIYISLKIFFPKVKKKIVDVNDNKPIVVD